MVCPFAFEIKQTVPLSSLPAKLSLSNTLVQAAYEEMCHEKLKRVQKKLRSRHCDATEVSLVGKIHQLLPQRAMIFIALLILKKVCIKQSDKESFFPDLSRLKPLLIGIDAPIRSLKEVLAKPPGGPLSERFLLNFPGLWPCPPTLQFVAYLYLALGETSSLPTFARNSADSPLYRYVYIISLICL